MFAVDATMNEYNSVATSVYTVFYGTSARSDNGNDLNVWSAHVDNAKQTVHDYFHILRWSMVLEHSAIDMRDKAHISDRRSHTK